MNATIDLPISEIRRFCGQNHIRKLSLFGSVLREDFGPDSDVDVLVEFEPDSHIGFFRFVELAAELSAMIGRKVDLNTPGFLSPRIRQKAIDSAQVIYERAG